MDKKSVRHRSDLMIDERLHPFLQRFDLDRGTTFPIAPSEMEVSDRGLRWHFRGP